MTFRVEVVVNRKLGHYFDILHLLKSEIDLQFLKIVVVFMLSEIFGRKNNFVNRFPKHLKRIVYGIHRI